MPRSQRAPESGSSLAETLIALAILAAALLSLAQLLTLSATLVSTSRHVTVGSILAAQKLEELRHIVGGSSAAPASNTGLEHVDRLGIPLDANRAGGVLYTREWRIRPLSVDPEQVTVIEVVVTPGPGRNGALDRARRPGEVVLVTMQTRDMR